MCGATQETADVCHNPNMRTVRQSAAERRLSLLQAALDLFAEQGYAATTTKAIALRSGVTEAILFRHFHTKEELLRAVVEQFRPRPLFSPPPPEVHSLPVRAALETFITRYLDAFWENRVLMLMIFTTPKREQAEFKVIWDEFGKQALYLYTMLQDRSDRRELKPDISAPATEIIAASTGGFLQRALNDSPEDWRTYRDHFVASLMQILFGGISLTD